MFHSLSYHSVSPYKPCINFCSPHAGHVPHPSHLPSFDHPNNILWVLSMKLFIILFSPASCYSLRMSSERAQFMNTFSLCLALTVRNQVSHPYNTIVKRENMNIYTHFKWNFSFLCMWKNTKIVTKLMFGFFFKQDTEFFAHKFLYSHGTQSHLTFNLLFCWFLYSY